jgi:hypothetical protein
MLPTCTTPAYRRRLRRAAIRRSACVLGLSLDEGESESLALEAIRASNPVVYRALDEFLANRDAWYEMHERFNASGNRGRLSGPQILEFIERGKAREASERRLGELLDWSSAHTTGFAAAARLNSLTQWFCDECGRIIEKPLDGTVEYRTALGPDRVHHSGFRIVHNGNGNEGLCRSSRGSDIPLDLLSREKGLLRLLGRQSDDPSWAETLRRVLVPHYEEARRHFDRARADGWEVIDDMLSGEKLLAIIEAFAK